MLYDKKMTSLRDKILGESLEPEPKKKKEEKVVTSTKKNKKSK